MRHQTPSAAALLARRIAEARGRIRAARNALNASGDATEAARAAYLRAAAQWHMGQRAAIGAAIASAATMASAHPGHMGSAPQWAPIAACAALALGAIASAIVTKIARKGGAL